MQYCTGSCASWPVFSTSVPKKPMPRQDTSIAKAPVHSKNRRPQMSERKIAGQVIRKFSRLMMTWNLFSFKPMSPNMRGPKYMNAFMPTNCCNNCKPTPMTINLVVKWSMYSWEDTFTFACSFCAEAMTSSSSRLASSSVSRIASIASLASSILPLCTSHRGDRGSSGMPATSTMAGTTCIPMAHRQPPSFSTRPVSTSDATRIPSVIMSW
mmetsp:Transcript_152810/g.388298  ORF Transcript_152810/g.388298 Transcript_152810/m.388298 type:complete len:211 (-) Transcript_152810:621-1253(-)